MFRSTQGRLGDGPRPVGRARTLLAIRGSSGRMSWLGRVPLTWLRTLPAATHAGIGPDAARSSSAARRAIARSTCERTRWAIDRNQEEAGTKGSLRHRGRQNAAIAPLVNRGPPTHRGLADVIDVNLNVPTHTHTSLTPKIIEDAAEADCLYQLDGRAQRHPRDGPP